MANDFSSDINCKALWRFESGALITDSKGTNTLTDNNTVQENTSNYKEGACAADFERNDTEYFSINDSSLDAGFPLKNGDTNKKISVCYWVNPESIAANGAHYAKGGNYAGDKGSFLITTDTIGKVIVYIGKASDGGDTYEALPTFGTGFSLGKWYHVCVTFDNSDKSYRIRIWDDEASDFLDSDITGTAVENINVEDGILEIGYWNGNYKLDGEMDELVVFDDILTVNDIDEIRSGTYINGLAHRRIFIT